MHVCFRVCSVREKQKAEGVAGAGAGERAERAEAAGALWPPLRAATPGTGDIEPRALCLSGVLQGALLAVLHRGVHRRAPDAPPPHAPPDHVLALAVYLLDAGAALHSERAAAGTQRDVVLAPPPHAAAAAAAAPPRPLLAAFAGRPLCDNVRAHVARVPARAAPAPAPAPPPPPAHYHRAHSDSKHTTTLLLPTNILITHFYVSTNQIMY